MPDTPDTDGNGYNADKNQGDENKDPHVSSSIKVVSCEKLKHEEQEVHCQADEHGLVLDILLCVQS